MSGNASAIARRVIATIARTKGIPKSRISLGTSFEQLGIDSLDAVEVLYEIEEEFDVKVPDDVARQIRTVREVVDRLRESLPEPHVAERP